MGDVLPPKRQAVVDRLRRRIENYRRRQTECVPRFDQSFSGACEQQGLETSALQRRFLEGKAKRAAKKGGDRRQPDHQAPPQQLQQLQQLQHPHALTSNLHSSVHVQKFLKRSADEGGGGGPGGGAGPSPPGKLQRTSGPSESLTKFSVEIVQQLEFTTSAADSQPQQISTNVTVKALTNASLKSESNTPLLECKRELDNEFVDLDQCAAALEKDANFPGFSDLIGDEAGDEIITSDAFKDLISDISGYPDLFDFEDKCGDSSGGDGGHCFPNNGQVKTEDLRGEQMSVRSSGDDSRGFGSRAGGYGGGELSPAAQTLKQMAEQHQHKQLGLGVRAARSPYTELHEYLSGPPTQFRKQDPVKQEPVFPYKQYSPYGSPGSAGHGSPGYLPRGPFGGPSPPRPPSGPPPQQQQSSQPPSGLHINQAQHLHISHPSHAIQVSAGQHMHLSGELQGAHVSVAAHQGMYFGQSPSQHQGAPSPHHHPSGPGSGDTYTVSQSQTINFTQQTLRQRQQQAQAAASSPMGPGGSPMGQQPSSMGGPNSQNVPTSVNGNSMGPSPQSMGMSNPNLNPNMAANMGNNVNAMGGMGPMGMTREQHTKLLQQQQMMRAQAMHQGPQGHLRPPPPDYKSSQGPMGGVHAPLQQRFPQPNIRRATHQAMPPSGPMMRAGGVVYGGGVGVGAGVGGNRYPPDWRHHLAMQQHQQQQQQQAAAAAAAAGFARHPANMSGFPQHPQHQGGFSMGGATTLQQQQQLHQQQQQQQQQLLRSQQQQLLPGQQHHQQLSQHLMAQQNQAISMQGQGQMSNLHMSQSQSISLHQNQNGGGMGNQGGSGQNPNGQQTGVNHFPSLHGSSNNAPISSDHATNSSSGFPGQPADFNLDFLESMQPGDSNNLIALELLNSLDNDPVFALQDML